VSIIDPHVNEALGLVAVAHLLLGFILLNTNLLGAQLFLDLLLVLLGCIVLIFGIQAVVKQVLEQCQRKVWAFSFELGLAGLLKLVFGCEELGLTELDLFLFAFEAVLLAHHEGFIPHVEVHVQIN